MFAQDIDPTFNPNLLIEDARFSDTQTFGGAEGIQKFLESKGSVLSNTNHDFLIKLHEPSDPALVILHWHGNEGSVTGHDNKALVTLGENEALLYHRITYAVSCDSAAVLGEEIVKKGDTTYIGYTKSFVFNFNPSYINQPIRDSRAAQFLNASNQVSLSLLKGHTAKEASKRSKRVFQQAILSLLSSVASDPYAMEDAKDLYWDMTHQVCLGDADARI